MPGESLSFSITADDRASSKFRDVGRSAADSAVKIDLAAASLKLWDDTAVKQGKAAATSQNAMKAHAAAAKLLADTENVLAGKATVTTKLLADQGRALDDTAKKAENAAAGFGAAAGGPGGGLAGGGMGALIAAGVALSPVIATLGTGLAGLGAAAYGIAKPIANAAQATGGLQKNLSKLDPEQQTVARGLLALGKTFAGFQHDLQPVVLGDFNQGLALARTLLHGVEPVAAATGKALGGFLGQINATFASGTWQNFFAFMQRTAGPDIALLGRNFTDLALALPPLVEQLQPVATDLLNITDAGAKLIGWTARANQSLDATGQHMNFLQHITASLRTLLFSPGAGLAAALKLLGLSGDTASKSMLHAGTVAGDLIHPLGAAAAATGIFAHQSVLSAAAAAAEAKQLNILAAGYEHALTPLENYISANITEANDLKALRVALRASGDTIGYKTQKERDSFSAAQTYIADTIKQGNAALSAHQGIDAQIRSIQNALPQLESVKGKTAAYRQELGLLKGVLDKLRAEKLISEQVRVTGSGTWHLARITTTGPQGQGVGRAAGGLIPGTGNSDSYPAMLTPGEVVVPKGMVRSGAVDHLRGSLPGFAAGGVVPSYSGPVAGLPPWTSSNQKATITALTASIGSAMASAFKAATQALAFTGGGGGGGAVSGGAVEALARRMFPWPSYMWTDFTLVESREAGWNIHARNPSSGAYGLAQFINGPGEYYQWGGNPNTAAGQLTGMFNYIASRYGNPLRAWGHELSFGWYDGGGALKPGWNLAYNGTGRPEMVLPNRGGAAAHVVFEVRGSDSETSQFLVRLLKRHVRVAGGGNVQTAFTTSR